MKSALLASSAVMGLLVLVGLPVGLWFLFRAIARAADRRALAHPPEIVGEPGRVTPALLGCAVGIPLLTMVLGGAGRNATAPIAILGGVLTVAAWLLHGLPGHSRNLKYVLYLLGSTMLMRAVGGFGNSTRGDTIVVALGAVNFLVAIASVVLLRPDAPLSPDDATSRRALRAYRVVSWMQGPDLLSMLAMGAFNIVQLGVPYMFVRWCANARAGRHAVVYLRSFHYDDAGRVFSQIVTPAVHRTTAVTGLVHVSQPTMALNRDVPLLWRAHFAAIADVQWKRWVERHLGSALAVVLDLSVATDALAWEIAYARTTVPAQRLLVLHRSGTAPNVDLPAVAYDLATTAGVDEARGRVSTWLQGALASANLTVGDGRALVSPPRRQFPMLALILLTTTLVGGILGTLAMVGVTKYVTAAHLSGLRFDLRTIPTAVEQWQLEGRAGCPTVDDLQREGFLGSGRPLRDPWGTAYRIECSDDPVAVRSAGADARFGTQDDVVSGR